MFAFRSRALARTLALSLVLLPVAGPVLADDTLTVSDPFCRGALCYVLVADPGGHGILVRARGLHRAQTLAIETREAMVAGRLTGRPAACAPVPELCPAG
ncbi:MAG: hypothetical protein ACOY5U_04555 [Pseudomonadota bacterium]